MKKITVDNYEAWFLDYIEGHLDEESKLELEAFLHLHPHLREEFEQASSFKLTLDSISFGNKESLKRFQFEKQSINPATFNDFCIAAHEGLLSDKKKEELSNYMQTDSALFMGYIAFGKTILKSEVILFPSKNKLYRRIVAAKQQKLFMWASVAAGLALMMGIYMGFFNEKTHIQIETATNLPKRTAIKPSIRPIEEKEVIVHSNPIQQRSVIIKERADVKVQTVVQEQPVEEAIVEAFSSPVIEPLTIAAIEPGINRNMDTISSIGVIENSNMGEGEKRKLLVLMEEGIEKLNKVTNSDNLALAHQTTSTGEIKSFRIKLGFIGYERKKGHRD